ncbi:MAG: AMP-binding protein [Candidatus Rokubacteria bacterium]|nr:AMP-binding protein [Candidatus Rokubacteria bacterium]
MAFDTDLSEERIRRAVEGGYWRNERIDAHLDRWATTRPAKTALVDGAGRYTWAELARTVERVAHGLAAHGVERGDVISCQLPNWNEFIIVLLAATRLGAVVHPIPPIFRASELRFMLNRLESRVVVIPGTFRGFDHVAMLQALRPEVPRVEHVFVARGTPAAGMLPFTALTDTAWEARPGRRDLPGGDPNEVNEVIFTSGTTGEPKGVMHTPNTALAIIYPAIERLGFSGCDVILMSSTFGHQTGYLYGYCLLLLLGATGVWLDVWNAAAAARLIEAERVTFTMGATPFLQDLAGVPARHDLSSLRLFISAGAPIPRPLVRDARARLGCAISPGWGMTENGLVTCTALDEREEKLFTTDGYPLRGMQLRVVDGDGREVATGTEGELLVRGPSQFVGYFKRPEFTSESYTAEGWFKTGDRGALDREGYLSITGRSKDLIIRGGENIPVVEVENVLFAHPKVASVAIVGMPDPRLGERACAFVVPKSGEPPSLAELVAFLEGQQLARQKFPERIEIVSEFPMTPSGKVQKFRLRQLIAEKLANESGRPG